MGRLSAADSGLFLLDGYSLLGQQTDFTFDFEAITEETTVLGNDDQTHAWVGVNKAAIEQSGFFDDGDQHTALTTPGGTADVLSFGQAGNTANALFIGFLGALESKYGINPARNTLHKAKASYIGSGKCCNNGKIVQPLATDTSGAAITGSTRDHGASSSAGGVGFLHVTGLTLGGYDDVTVKIAASVDGSTWADLITFTDVAAIGAQAIEVSGTINRYIRATVQFNGTGSAQSITYFVGLARN